MKSPQRLVAPLVVIALLAGGPSKSSACSIPVFRYALELWPPDQFELYLFQQGELSESERELVARLNSKTLGNEVNARLNVRNLASELDPEALSVWESLDLEELNTPLLVLQTPSRRGPSATVLTLELSAENVEQLLDSPARKEIARRILEGHSVVWVLLESGQADQDEQAFETLNVQIQRLEEALELSEPDPKDLQLLSSDSEPLELVFSSLRVRRDDPEERTLVELLLNVEPDLRDPQFADMPMVFPVFGRGRALYALVGAGITPSTIEEAALYLTGDCQCTVKAENPGVDLLLAVDWDRLVTPTLQHDQELPPLGGVASFADLSVEETLNDQPASEQETETDAEARARPQSAFTTARNPSETTDSETIEASAHRPSSSQSSGPPRMGLSALLLVSLLGVLVFAAGVVLTRRET